MNANDDEPDYLSTVNVSVVECEVLPLVPVIVIG